MEQAKIIKYKDTDTFEPLAQLADDILKVVPNISVKTFEMTTHWINHNDYPKGVAYCFHVYHDSDPSNSIGKLSIENWAQKTPKFCIQNNNITDGRQSWGDNGQFKTSIHAKNIVRIAKKVFKPLTFQQIAMKHFREFSGKIDSLRHSMTWQARANTCHDFEDFAEDFYKLKAMGYEPINPNIKKWIDYAVENREKLEKYLKYNPDYYFVSVKENEVQYCLRQNQNSFPNPTIVASKDELPEDIKGKLFVLDITDSKDFVEDVGLKENNGAYWIIA